MLNALLTACALIAGIVLYFYALLLYASLVVALGANHAFTLAHYRVIPAQLSGGEQRSPGMSWPPTSTRSYVTRRACR